MASYIIDIETNGFLDTLTVIHSIVLKDVDTGEVFSYADQDGYSNIALGLALAAKADALIGHNIIKFDIPALLKVYPGCMQFDIHNIDKYRDTLVYTRMLWPDLKEGDVIRTRKGKFPGGKLTGSHSLKAWGHRLGVIKGEFGGSVEAFEKWTPEMQAYCEQDVEVTFALYEAICKKADRSRQAETLEHEFAYIIAEQERRGIQFNERAAIDLYTTLVKRRKELTAELQAAFPPETIETVFTPKVNNKKQGYVKGVPFTKRKVVEFNPSSRQMIARRLQALGWEPQEFTDNGQPKIDETILSGLPYPQAQVLAEHFLIEKRIGQVAEGEQAWLKVLRNGRIHGSVNPCGTPTGRCTHSMPNVTQVPKVGKPFGRECRALFMATTGMVFVGADLSGIELRMLAHYMAAYDGGLFAKVLLEGDVHWVNVLAMGLTTGERDKHSEFHAILRESGAKRFIYAFLYGCGNHKAGTIIHDLVLDIRRAGLEAEATKLSLQFFGTNETPSDNQLVAAGKKLKSQYLRKTPALQKLRDAVTEKAKAKGTLKAIDGRTLHVRSAHAALNTLLQAAGAITAKLATVIAYKRLLAAGFVQGRDFAQVIHAHDELQNESKPEIAQAVGETVVASMEEAGRVLNYRLPIAGEFKVGNNWADTH